MTLTEPFDSIAAETSHEKKPVARRRGGVHDFRPARDEVQRIDHAQETCGTPGRHFADAIAGNDKTVRHQVTQGRRRSQRLELAKYLPGAILVQDIARSGPDDLARIPSAEQGCGMSEQISSFRRIASQGEHAGMLTPLSATQDRKRHCLAPQ